MGKLYLAIAFVLAGSSVVAARFISDYLPPFATILLSLGFASLTALLFCGKSMFTTVKQMSRQRWMVITLQAIFGSFLFRIFLTIGLQYIGTTEAGIITGASPAITALLTWLMLRELLNLRTVLGVLMTLAGIMLVQGFPIELSASRVHPLGVILVICAATCESLFTTLSRKLHIETQEEEQPLPPVVHAGLVSLIATVLSLIPACMEKPWSAITTLPASGWLALIWYGAVVTIVAFACMFAGAKRCDGYTIAAFSGLIPISSTLLSVTVLRETIDGFQLAGCLIVVLATLVISGWKKHTPVSS